MPNDPNGEPFTPEHLAAARDLAEYIERWSTRHRLHPADLLFTLCQFASDAALSLDLPFDEWVPLLRECYELSIEAAATRPAPPNEKRTPSQQHSRAKAGRRRQRQARRKGRPD